jgi:membrane protein implicated in regulation of membrane protease activity
MDEPETWRWIWLIAALVFAGGELAMAGTFFLAPFAVGAAAAALLAFLDVAVVVQWLAFVGLSFGTFALLRPLARRLDQDEPTDGIGSKRLIGEAGTVLETIPAGLHELGMVRVHREEWRAQTPDGVPVEVGAQIQVVDQRGTRLVVMRTAPGVVPPARPPKLPRTDPEEP